MYSSVLLVTGGKDINLFQQSSLKNPFRYLIGYVNITYETVNSFESIDKLGLLTETSICLVTSDNIPEEILNNPNVVINFYPVENNFYKLKSNFLFSERFEILLRKDTQNLKDKDKKIDNIKQLNNFKINETDYLLGILNNTLGETLLLSKETILKYFSLYSFNKYIEEKNLTRSFKLLYLYKAEKSINYNKDFKYKLNNLNPNNEKKIFIELIELSQHFLLNRDKKRENISEEDLNNINKEVNDNLDEDEKDILLYSQAYFFTLDNIEEGEGFIVTDTFKVIGKFANIVDDVEFIKKYGEDKINEIKEKIGGNYKKIIVCNIFNKKSRSDYKATKSFLYSQRNINLIKLIYNEKDYIDIQKKFFYNKKIDIDLAKNLVLSGDSLIQRLNDVRIISSNILDKDIIIRKLFFDNFNQINFDEFIINNLNFKTNYMITIFSILFFHKLKILNITDSEIKNKQFPYLINLLYYNITIEKLILRNITILSENLNLIIKALKNNLNLEYLDLSYNKISKKAGYYDILKKGIKGEKNKIDNEVDLSYLNEISTFKKLKYLNLSYILNFGFHNKNLENFLNYKNNNINNNENYYFNNLECLDLSGSNFKIVKNINFLCKFLANLDNLNSLILKNCGINDEGIVNLLNTFMNLNKLFKKLDLSNNELTSNSSNIFNKYFQFVSKIQENNIKNKNNINENNNEEEIFTSNKNKKIKKEDNENYYIINLNNNVNLNNYKNKNNLNKGFMYESMNFKEKTILELKNTHIDCDILTVFYNIITNNDDLNITQLNLSNNNFTSEDLKNSEILTGIGKNKHFEVLYIQGNNIEIENIKEYINNRNNKSLIVCDYIENNNNLIINNLVNYIKFIKKKKKKDKKKNGKKQNK
jgi:hypothetical protein